MESIAAIILISAPFVGGILVLASNYIKKNSNFDEFSSITNQKNFLPERTSYERYKRVSSKTSVRNSIVRKSGDFLDFLLSDDTDKTEQNTECNLRSIICGEVYD